MRQALLGLAVVIAGLAELASTLIYLAAWGGILVYLFLSGYVLWTALWFIFGPLPVAFGVSLLRLPFILLGYLLAALAGATDDYAAALERLNNR
ncbi:MAG: hypothetical protein K6U88_09015 [Dehalococcoidia bacterium]|nr:hypothetical protein [Dehalococcoidia bacterium]